MFVHSFLTVNNSLVREALDGTSNTSIMMGVLIALYGAFLILLSFYGGHRYVLLFNYLRSRRKKTEPVGRYADEDLPGVTVQLPLYNELYVVDRLLESVSQLDYPRDRFQIQVLDDSTDETVDLVRAAVVRLRADGLDIEHVHRSDRTGFKAGALENGLKSAKYDLLAIFDADFRPEPDFLKQMVHYFTDPLVGAAQSRWGHMNEEQSLLTQTQGLMLNGHFMIEHPGRNKNGLFMNFNGTGGLWRRQAIVDAGGWHHDTITEDLDLSYRAQMAGWKVAYDADVVCPAELPVEMNAFKSQQHRWAKGSIQTMLKIIPQLMRSSHPFRIKFEGFMHLTSNLAFLVMVPMCLLSFPMLVMRARIADGTIGLIVDVGILLCATASVVVFYTATQMVGYKSWWKRWYLVPTLMAVAVGLTVNQAKAVFEAVIGNESAFVRTPKFNQDGTSKGNSGWLAKRYRGARGLVPILELLFALYFTVSLGYCIRQQLWMTVPFVMIFFTGFWYVSLMSLFQGRRRVVTVADPAPAGA